MQVVHPVNGTGPVPSPEAVSLSDTAIKREGITFGMLNLWATKAFWISVTRRLLGAYMIPQADTFCPCQRQGNRCSFGWTGIVILAFYACCTQEG